MSGWTSLNCPTLGRRAIQHLAVFRFLQHGDLAGWRNQQILRFLKEHEAVHCQAAPVSDPPLDWVSLIIFIIMAVIPGDVAVAILGDAANQKTVAELREQLGLNAPLYERYWNWISGMFSGDLGYSVFLGGRPIAELMIEHFPVTLNLAVYTMIIAVVLAVPWAPSAPSGTTRGLTMCCGSSASLACPCRCSGWAS